MDDIWAQYYEDLLRLQYRISENIHQKLPRGTIREDFLRDILLSRRNSICIKKGIVSYRQNQSGECDHIYFEDNASIVPLGEQVVIEPKYCKLILEIKSNATSTDIKKSNANFHNIKNIAPNIIPKCGIFCYNTKLTKKTILNRFGWTYDFETDSWKDDGSMSIIYPSIDFITNIACIDEDESCTENQFFLMKDSSSGRYSLVLDYPIIKNFFSIIENL